MAMVRREAHGVLPVGFGRGRRTNRIVVVETVTSSTKCLPSRIERWGQSDEREAWARIVHSGCLAAAEKTGFDLVWHFWGKDETPEGLATWVEEQADGAIVMGPEDEHLALPSELARRNVPVVILCASHPRPDVPYVLCDNAGGIRLVVKHLVELGRVIALS